MPGSFYVCLVGCLITIVILLVVLVIRVDQLTVIKNQLYKIVDSVYPIDNHITSAWSTIISIRNDTAKMAGLLDKDEEKEEHTDISEEGWAMAPCPVCNGPARMRYDRDTSGYFVQCARHDNYNTCDYSTVAGGASMKTAADMWNKSVETYCNIQNRNVVRLPYMEKERKKECKS